MCSFISKTASIFIIKTDFHRNGIRTAFIVIKLCVLSNATDVTAISFWTIIFVNSRYFSYLFSAFYPIQFICQHLGKSSCEVKVGQSHGRHSFSWLPSNLSLSATSPIEPYSYPQQQPFLQGAFSFCAFIPALKSICIFKDPAINISKKGL